MSIKANLKEERIYIYIYIYSDDIGLVAELCTSQKGYTWYINLKKHLQVYGSFIEHSLCTLCSYSF